MNVCGLPAQAGGAGVVVPTQAKIIHPPDLGFIRDGDVDTDEGQILEGGIKVDGKKITVSKCWTGRNRDGLSCDLDLNL